MIAKELLIEFCSLIVPLKEDVILLLPLTTLSNLSSLVIIRGVSKIVFWTIKSEMILAYLIPPEVSIFCVLVACDGYS